MTELEIIQVFCEKKELDFIELQKEPVAKFSIIEAGDGNKLKTIVGWATVRVTKHNFNTYSEIMIDLISFEEGYRAAHTTGIPFYLIISCYDGIYYAAYDGLSRVHLAVKHGIIGDEIPRTYAFLPRLDFQALA